MVAVAAVRVAVLHDVAVELHREQHLGSCELPGIAVTQPVVRVLDLPAVLDALTEHAVLVADAVAVAGQAQGGDGIQEAGSEPAEAAVAERGVVLHLTDHVVFEADLAHGLAALVHETEIEQAVGERAADEEFQGQVIHALGVGVVIGAHGFHPALDEALAHGVGERQKPVAILGGDVVLADAVDQLIGDGALDGGGVHALIIMAEHAGFQHLAHDCLLAPGRMTGDRRDAGWEK